jgi:methionyl-tRNA formyltransferase
MSLRVVFMGTPDFAVPTLSEIVGQGHEVVAVYTRPPAAAGRGMELKLSPVHRMAERFGLPVLTPKTLRTEEATETFRSHEADVAVVVAYGMLLPKPVLDAPQLGCLNLHASLLPRWRGAAPIQRAIMAGDKITGVQVMRMSVGLDEGPVLSSATVRIDALDTAGSLHDRLAQAGALLLPRTLADIAAGTATETAQAEDGVTYAKKIKPAEARIDWTRPAVEVDRQIRGLSPFPGAWFMAPSQRGPTRVKALLSCVEDGEGRPGEVLDGRLRIACGEGAVRLLKAQREGRGVQDLDDFVRGFPLPAGERLD